MQHFVQQTPVTRRDDRSLDPHIEPAGNALNAGPGVTSLMQLQSMLNDRPAVVTQLQLARDLSRRAVSPAPIQRINRTGLPDRLKAGAESLSGLSLDDVRVHYNSAEPATLQAAAYARGSDIHVGPGQERHLPHEAWHVVQQKQGRVRPTLQAKGVAINDDSGLESEADTMGAQALRTPRRADADAPAQAGSVSGPVQRVIGEKPDGGFKSNLKWGEWFSAMTADEVRQEATKLGLARGALQNMNGTLQRNNKALIKIPEDYVDPIDAAIPERRTAKKIVGSEGSEAIELTDFRMAPIHVSSDVSRMPPQHQGQVMSAREIGEILRHVAYRHGDVEAGNLDTAIREEERHGPVSLPQLLQKLAEGGKAQKRSGYLLKLTLSDLESGEGEGGAEGWGMFAAVVEFIQAHAASFNADQLGNADRDIGGLLNIERRTWQAAAIAALRNRALNSVGFQQLSELLLAVTGRRMLDYKARDVQHEIALQVLRHRPGKTGTAEHPSYENIGPISASASGKADDLNSRSSMFSKLVQSGAYKSENGLVTKSLDIGHKGVDVYENVAHRNKNTVSSDTNFAYLALLSPNEKQQAVGANGKVLGDGSYMFVVDRQFRLRYMPAANFIGEGGPAKNFVQFIPHSQLANRADVLGAGNFFIRDGHFVWIDNGSGHYRVNAGVNQANVTASLHALGYQTVGIRFLDRGAGDLDATYKKGNAILEKLESGRPDATLEIRAMERAMNLIASGDRSRSRATTALPGASGGVRAQNPGIVRIAPDEIRDPVFGQNERLTEHITDDRL